MMFSVAAIFVAVMTSSTVPAYATYVSFTGPWPINQAVPVGCTGVPPAPMQCAQASSNANSGAYTKVSQTWSTATAWVRNNAILGSPNQVGANPTMTVLPGAVSAWGDTTVNFDSHIRADALNGEAAFWIDGLIFQDGNFVARYGANAKISGAGDHIQTGYVSSGSYPHSGTHTYKLGGEIEALSSTNAFSGTNEVDLWNSPHYVKVTMLAVHT